MPSFDLYIDESGLFDEDSRDRQSCDFASQLAGLLVPQHELKKDLAEQILEEGYKAARYADFPKTVHGTKLRPGEGYDRLIQYLLKRIQQQKWQPVRLVNQERVDYGDRVLNYVNILAELALRIYQQKSKEGVSEIVLNFYCAVVYLGDDEDGEPLFIESESYLQCLRDYLAFIAVRQGFAEASSQWRIGKFCLFSANIDRRLQICDLLSNASHNNYKKSGDITSANLKQSFGNYEWSMALDLLSEKCELLIREGSLGMAIRAIAERLLLDERQGTDRDEAENRLEIVIDRLSNFDASSRNIQLSTLTSWLQQIVNQQRSLELGYKVAQWLQTKVNAPLLTKLGEESQTLSWFSYALHFWVLTACNHLGNLVGAGKEADALTPLAPALAGQWEHVTLLMEGLVAEAVYRTDCLEYDAVAQKMKLVVSYYGDVSSLFPDAFPGLFPERVHSELRGKALGTWLQSEIYAGAFDRDRLITARELSEECIEEFVAPEDKHRQYQYRCQLETAARDFAAARQFLAKSLVLEDATHLAIAQAIKTLDIIPQGFALLHWLRLGTSAYISGNGTEWREFEEALDRAKLLNYPWCNGGQSRDYPTHGILRRVALINAIGRQQNNSALGGLKNLAPLKKGSMVLSLIQTAAYAEVAAIAWENDATYATKLLDCRDRDRLGLKQQLEEIAAKSRGRFPKVWELTQSWLGVVEDVLASKVAGSEVRERLLRLGRQIGY